MPCGTQSGNYEQKNAMDTGGLKRHRTSTQGDTHTDIRTEQRKNTVYTSSFEQREYGTTTERISVCIGVCAVGDLASGDQPHSKSRWLRHRTVSYCSMKKARTHNSS